MAPPPQITAAALLVIIATTSAYVMGVGKICPIGPCGPGQKFDPTNKLCLPCDPDQFLNRTNHGCVDCEICSRAEEHNREVVISNCTDTKNTVLGCMGGYYFRIGSSRSKGRCQLCTDCQIQNKTTIEPCGVFKDTVCSDLTKDVADVTMDMTGVTRDRIDGATEIVANIIKQWSSTEESKVLLLFTPKDGNNKTREEAEDTTDTSVPVLKIALPTTLILVVALAMSAACWYKRRHQISKTYSPAPAEELAEHGV